MLDAIAQNIVDYYDRRRAADPTFVYPLGILDLKDALFAARERADEKTDAECEAFDNAVTAAIESTNDPIDREWQEACEQFADVRAKYADALIELNHLRATVKRLSADVDYFKRYAEGNGRELARRQHEVECAREVLGQIVDRYRIADDSAGIHSHDVPLIDMANAAVDSHARLAAERDDQSRQRKENATDLARAETIIGEQRETVQALAAERDAMERRVGELCADVAEALGIDKEGDDCYVIECARNLRATVAGQRDEIALFQKAAAAAAHRIRAEVARMSNDTDMRGTECERWFPQALARLDAIAARLTDASFDYDLFAWLETGAGK